MKILHLVQRAQLRGAEVFTSQLASHINRKGHEAIIVCLFPGNGDLPFEGLILQLGGNPKKRLYDFKAWRKLAQIVNEFKPDIVQANAGDTLKYAVSSKVLFKWRQPIVFRNASTISLYIKGALSRLYNDLFFERTCKVISVSNTCAKDFIKLYPNHQNKVVTIPIGIEHTSDVNKINKNSSFVKKLVHVGGFTYEKNHEGVISIFERILAKGINATLHLVGSGPLENDIRELVKLKKLENKVVFHGYQKNAIAYIAEADVLLLPSIIEGLPGVILEAFYCMTPVVTYNVGGIPEIVINNKTGRLVDRDNEHEFANAVIAALDSTEVNQILKVNAYNLVTTQYLNEEIADSFLQNYEVMVNQHVTIDPNGDNKNTVYPK